MNWSTLCRCVPTLCLGLGLVSWAVGVQAEEAVFLRGHRTTPSHVVFGSVDRVRSDRAKLNLGYAHGVRPGMTLLGVRTVDSQVIPVAGLLVLETEEDQSTARVEGPFRLQAGDFVLIHASRLRLWGGQPRMERLLRDRLSRRMGAPGYDTLGTSARLIDEVARDDEYLEKQYTGQTETDFLKDSSGRLGPLASRLGAVAPTTQLNPADNAEAGAAAPADPTLEGLGRFADNVRNPETLRRLLTLERLQRLTPIDATFQLTETNAFLVRGTLQTWTAAALRRAE